jgi:hypothetical protein
VRAVAALKALPDTEAASLPVGLARAGMGVATLLGAAEMARGLKALHTPGVLRIPRFESLPVLPQSAVALFLGAWVLAGIAFCLGWHTRTAGVLLTGFQVYALALDHQLYSNHLYLMALFTLLLTLADSGASFSLDAHRRGSVPYIPAWPVGLMRVLISIVYGFAVLAKLNAFFLSGIVLRQNMKVPGMENLPNWAFTVLALASVATEAFLAYAFWRRRVRVFAFLVGLGFHVTIVFTMWLFPDLLTFAVIMGSAYLAFFSRFRPVERGPAPTGRGGEVLALRV